MTQKPYFLCSFVSRWSRRATKLAVQRWSGIGRGLESPPSFPMNHSMRSRQPAQTPEEVEQLLINARLRDALDPYVDDSMLPLKSRRLTTAAENEFLASLLAWERAPVEPISRWFDPELVLPHPAQLSEEGLRDALRQAIDRLYQRRIVLQWTDHLSDRQLYLILYRDLLPTEQKNLDLRDQYQVWRFLDIEEDTELWLRYYATDEERRDWSECSGEPPPPAERAPYPRLLPTCPPRG